MIYIKDLKVNNFRCFDSLSIEGFSKINLFAGKNNSGKTSVLESLLLMVGMSNPQLLHSINAVRGIKSFDAKNLEYLFHNLELDKKPSFYTTYSDQSERRLEFNAIYSQDPSILDTSVGKPVITGLDLNFSLKKEQGSLKNHKSSITFENNKIEQKVPKDYQEDLYGRFISPGKNDEGVFKRYSEIAKRKESDFILDALKEFDPAIRSITPLADGLYFDIKDIEELVPVNVLGDGIRRFLDIITAISERQNSFVFIDEIENGLHYSVYRLLWKNLISFADKNNVQLFITTHSLETLTCLKALLEKEECAEMRDSVKVFTLSKTLKAGYKAYRYSYEGFQSAIDNEIEIRS